MDTKKKVLLIAESNMSLSGVPVVYMSIVKALHKTHSFDLVVLKDNDFHFREEFLSYGGKIYLFNPNKPSGFISKIFWTLFKYPKKCKLFSSEINLRQYDIIHSFNEYISYPFFKKAKSFGVKKRIIHICSADSAYPKPKTINQFWWNKLQKKSFRYCTDIISVSNQTLKYHNYKNKGVVLYNPFNIESHSSLVPCVHNNLVLTQIGNFYARKNQLFSLEVMKIIVKSIPNAVLNFVGNTNNDGYLEQLESEVYNNGLTKNVKFLGNSPDRMQLNSNTSYYIYPSTRESFGLVLLEGQAIGIHCFTSNTIPHDADMGNVDFLDLNPNLWANKILEFFEKSGNKRVKPLNIERFSEPTFYNNILSIYSI